MIEPGKYGLYFWQITPADWIKRCPGILICTILINFYRNRGLSKSRCIPMSIARGIRHGISIRFGVICSPLSEEIIGYYDPAI